MRKLLLFLLIITGSLSLTAQTVPILTFDSFEKYLKPTSDTIYVINFWATWCKPCVAELPSFEKLNESYKNKKVKVILTSLDFKSQYDKVVAFTQKNKMKSQVILLDSGGSNSFIDKINASWEGTIPATLVIQSSSNTRKFFAQPFTYEQLEKIIKPLIKT